MRQAKRAKAGGGRPVGKQFRLGRAARPVTLLLLLAVRAVATASPMLAETPAGLVLTRDGQPAAALVVPQGSGTRSPEWRAAQLVQTLVREMAGAELPILNETKLRVVHRATGGIHVTNQVLTVSNFVLVGVSRLTDALGATTNTLGPGGIRLHSQANVLVLLGGPANRADDPGLDTGGLRYAALELLEQLGCRYLWPGRLGMVIPQTPTLIAPPLDIAYTPPIRGRGIRWGSVTGERTQTGLKALGMTEEQWLGARQQAMADAPAITWSAWQRLGGSMPAFGHAGAGLRDAERHLREHPEWFARQADGTRDQMGSDRWRLCKSNPELIAHVADDIIRRANTDPNLTLVSLDPNDGGGNTGWCRCSNCLALDPPQAPRVRQMIFHAPTTPGSRTRRREIIEAPALTDRLIYYWNSIAERVTQQHPHLLFGVSAYGGFSTPPVARKLHPNLVVRFVPFATNAFQGWRDAGAQRIYWRPNILGTGRRDAKLRSYIGPLCANMRYFVDAGVNQIDFDSIGHSWAVLGLNYYAAARLAWNPSLTAEAIIDDYATAGFGPAASEIAAYIRRVEALTTGITATPDDDDEPEPLLTSGVKASFASDADYRYTPAVVAELLGLLRAADAKTDDPVIVARIAFLRLGLNFTELQERLDVLAWRAGQGDATTREEARRLIDLNTLTVRDILLRHPLAVNIPSLVWGSGTFARFAPIRGRTVKPSNPALLERLGSPGFGLTGYEESLDAMLQAFGLYQPQTWN